MLGKVRTAHERRWVMLFSSHPSLQYVRALPSWRWHCSPCKPCSGWQRKKGWNKLSALVSIPVIHSFFLKTTLQTVMKIEQKFCFSLFPRHSSSEDPLPPTRPHLLKFPPSPKTVPPARDQHCKEQFIVKPKHYLSALWS
jgi:hypothetical protein